MGNTRAKLIGGWSAAVIGVALTALPLYAELFTMEQVSSETTESALSASTTVRYTMMQFPLGHPSREASSLSSAGSLLGARGDPIPMPLWLNKPGNSTGKEVGSGRAGAEGRGWSDRTDGA